MYSTVNQYTVDFSITAGSVAVSGYEIHVDARHQLHDEIVRTYLRTCIRALYKLVLLTQDKHA